jgi:metallo-beta-lactamase family protein
VGPFTARFTQEGHILGAAGVRLSCREGAVFFSGDVGRPHDPLMNAPAPPQQADVLVVESTYGARTHSEVDVTAVLADVVTRTVARGGVLLVPAFAVGRTQVVQHLLAQLKAEGRIPNIPIFIDSPMAIDVTALHMQHAGQHRLDATQSEAMSHVAKLVRTVDESKALNAKTGPFIVIAGSGMATGGRIIHHLATRIDDARNTVLLVGYQSPGTRGASLAAHVAALKFHGHFTPVNAEVVQMDALSGHADGNELIAWLRTAPAPYRRVVVNHGDPESAAALAARITRELGWPASVADEAQTVPVSA